MELAKGSRPSRLDAVLNSTSDVFTVHITGSNIHVLSDHILH